jgi:hypothetical protein
MNALTTNRYPARAKSRQDIFNAMFNRFAHEASVQRHCQTDDDRLQVLWKRSAAVNEDVQNIIQLTDAERPMLEMNLRISLVACATAAVTWAYPQGNGPRSTGYQRIRREREHQRDLFRRGRISFDVASPIIDVRRKFRVLAEEVGEVAHAIDQVENHGMVASNIKLELIQVAAVCVAWLESMEVPS